MIQIDGQPWFAAADVCKALGFFVKSNGTVNVFNATYHLDAADTSTAKISETGRSSKIISESGLYKLIMRSDKPEAKGFQDWVTRDVLPVIRKDGMYVAGEEKVGHQ